MLNVKAILFLFQLLLGFFGTILCMRAQLVERPVDPPESPQNKLNKYKREKNILNEFKYDKVATFEVQRDDPWKILPNGTNKLKTDSDVYVEPSPTHFQILNALETEVKDIKRHLRIITDKMMEKDGKDKISKEWKLVAIVMDRVFFVFYLCVIAVSVFFVFPKSLWEGK